MVLFRNISESILKLDKFHDEIESCKWDIESMEADIKCNSYVHDMLADFKVFFERLKSDELTTMSEDVRQTITESAITMGMKVLIEGYSRVKKCTNEGRVKMAFDVKKFQMGLQDITQLRPHTLPLFPCVLHSRSPVFCCFALVGRPIPGVILVEEYVGGYMEFVGATDELKVFEWITKHVHCYTEEQIKSLLTVSYIEFNKLKRQQKDTLLKKVEETYQELL